MAAFGVSGYGFCGWSAGDRRIGDTEIREDGEGSLFVADGDLVAVLTAQLGFEGRWA